MLSLRGSISYPTNLIELSESNLTHRPLLSRSMMPSINRSQKENYQQVKSRFIQQHSYGAWQKPLGKALPMIHDTPLGRLDSNHRQLLVERYFPYASHQMILLSTDTEIEQSFLSSWEPHVSHTFHLVYQPNEACTTIEEGYFGKPLCN